MNTIYDYLTHAELSLAAYASFNTGVIDPRELVKDTVGMTAVQAAHFAATYTVISQFTDPATGLSATVFENVADGKRYLAIRGTNDLNDIVTDFVDIAVLGTPERQAQYAALKDQVGAWLSDGTLTAGFTVTGHSLGGFLAGALLVDYPVEIGHAYLYNAPGIGGLSAGLRLLMGLETDPTLDLTKVSNLISEAGISLTAGLGLDWGAPIAIAIEDQAPNLIANHSIKYLTDALAIYDLFARVDPSVSVETVTDILKAASNQNANTLESALSALSWVYFKSYSAGETSRDAFYTNLYELQGVIGSNQGTVVSLTGQSREQIASLAKTDIAYRHALEWLDPFVVTGNPGLYTNRNIDGHLDADQLFSDTTAWRMAA